MDLQVTLFWHDSRHSVILRIPGIVVNVSPGDWYTDPVINSNVDNESSGHDEDEGATRDPDPDPSTGASVGSSWANTIFRQFQWPISDDDQIVQYPNQWIWYWNGDEKLTIENKCDKKIIG